MILLSILITVYNSEIYLKKVFDSLLLQTNKNFDVLVCDDGSTDNSRAIMNDYNEKFIRSGIKFKTVFQDNKGVSSAVNALLPLVNSEYFVICDSDDWFPSDAVSTLSSYVNNSKGNYDLFIFNADYYNEKYEYLYTKKSKALKRKNLFNEAISGEYLPSFAGSNIYKTSSFLRFNGSNQILDNKHGQNWQLLLPFLYFGKAMICDHLFYNVYKRSRSNSTGDGSLYFYIDKNKNYIEILKGVFAKIGLDNKILERATRKFYNIICNCYFALFDKNNFNKYYDRSSKSLNLTIKKIILNVKIVGIIYKRIKGKK